MLYKTNASLSAADFEEGAITERQSEAGASTFDLEAEANSTPIIKFVSLVLYQAIKDKATLAARMSKAQIAEAERRMKAWKPHGH